MKTIKKQKMKAKNHSLKFGITITVNTKLFEKLNRLQAKYYINRSDVIDLALENVTDKQMERYLSKAKKKYREDYLIKMKTQKRKDKI